jgi:HAD superfamily hydrolase (TIGR01509 family)
VELHSFAERYFTHLEPNDAMIAFLGELRDRGYRLGLLTNNVREWEPRWRSMLPIDELFETITDSGFEGTRKPETRIFEICFERIQALTGLEDVKREECVLVDDIELNIDAAREFGLKAVRYQGECSDVLAELKPLLA